MSVEKRLVELGITLPEAPLLTGHRTCWWRSSVSGGVMPACSAVGISSLPLNTPVEIEIIAEFE